MKNLFPIVLDHDYPCSNVPTFELEVYHSGVYVLTFQHNAAHYKEMLMFLNAVHKNLETNEAFTVDIVTKKSLFGSEKFNFSIDSQYMSSESVYKWLRECAHSNNFLLLLKQSSDA